MIEKVLNLGRRTSSGDNIQPWRFRILDEATVAVDIREEAAGQL